MTDRGSAPAAPSPARAAAAAPAATTTATPSATTTGTTSTAPSATPNNNGGQLHVAANVFVIEEMEGGETHVGHFLFAKDEALIGRDVVGLRAHGSRYRGCGCAPRQRKTEARHGRHGNAVGCAPLLRGVTWTCHGRNLLQVVVKGQLDVAPVRVDRGNATWRAQFLSGEDFFHVFRNADGFDPSRRFLSGLRRRLLPKGKRERAWPRNNSRSRKRQALGSAAFGKNSCSPLIL